MGAFKAVKYLVLGACLAGSAPLRAWDPELHAVVAAMAQARLSPPARAGLVRLRMDAVTAGVDLRCHEGDPAFGFIDRDLERFLDLDHPLDLALLGSWADGWRTNHPETAGWHFIELDPHGPMDALAVDNACPGGDCVSAQITRQQGRLADASLGVRERFMALCFLVHLVADAHQPLHCAGLDQDHGGNRRLVLYAGQVLSLHAAWDQGFLDPVRGRGRGRKKGKRKGAEGPRPGVWDRRQAAALVRDLGQSVRGEDAWDWTRGSPTDWVLQSAEEARCMAYGALPVGPPPQILGRDYVRRAQPVVRRQLQRAAVRLAALLDESLR